MSGPRFGTWKLIPRRAASLHLGWEWVEQNQTGVVRKWMLKEVKCVDTFFKKFNVDGQQRNGEAGNWKGGHRGGFKDES